MGQKRAHLAFSTERPELNESELTQLERYPNRLKRYEDKTIEAQEKWDDRNDIACSKLAESTTDSTNDEARQMVLEGIRSGKTAKEISDSILKRYSNTDPRVVNATIKRWTSLQAAPGERATSYITRLKELKEELRQKGKEYSNGELVGRLLDGLKESEEYRANVAALETIKDLDFEEAVRQLQTKDETIMASSGVGAKITETAAMAFSSQQKRGASNAQTSNVTCQICKRTGHTAYICRWRHDPKDQSKKNNNQQGKGNKRASVKCFNCNKMGHYSNECRAPKKKKNGNNNNNKHTNEGPENKRQKTNGGHGDWDAEEFSGMMQEQK